MSEPVVVQGTEVSYGPPPTTSHSKQAKCQDPVWAALFYFDVIAVCAVAGIYGEAALVDENNPFHEDYLGYYYSAIISGIVGLVLSGGGLQVMMCIPETMIKAGLIFSVVVAAFVLAMNIVSGNVIGIAISAVVFALSCCYCYCVWSRIPFATINLVTGMTAVKANGGVIIVTYFFSILTCLWAFVWAVAMLGTYDTTHTCTNPEAQTGCAVSGAGWGYLFLLFVALFFSVQVLQNVIHVTVAGVTATWWISPQDANSCCSTAVWDSVKRSWTTSFGSICFGSLLAALVQALRALANVARSQDDSILLCLAECILACIQNLIEYFNKWAFIYVGIYGMSYCESGKEVMTLFSNRGWEAIIADDLVGNTLLLVSVMVGGLCGVVGILIEYSSGWLEESAPGNETSFAFGVAFVVGLLLCSIMMSVVASAVNAVLVLFAEKPAELQQNHPELSARMREIWSQIYPGSV